MIVSIVPTSTYSRTRCKPVRPWTRKYKVARQKNLKGSLPMSTTNKGHIKTGHKTMIYVLSLMRLLSVGQSTYGSVCPSVHRSSIRTHEPSFGSSSSFFVPSYYLSYSLLPSPFSSFSSSSSFSFFLHLLYRFRRIAPTGRR